MNTAVKHSKPYETFFLKITFFIYHLFLRLILFCLKLFKFYLSAKLQKYLADRSYPQLIWRKDPLPHQRRIWFHASSGEVEYIKSLLKLWKSTYPQDLLFLSYFSPSALDLIPRISEIDGWAPLPVDLPRPCHNFITTLKPDILIIARTDLWPTLLKSLPHQSKILMASTWSEGSKKTQKYGRWMSQWCLPYLNKICVVNEEDKQWIEKNLQSIPEIVVTGDPRFDQVQTRLEQKRPLPLLLTQWVQISSTSQRLFIAGSTWEQDEEVLFNSIKQIIQPSTSLQPQSHPSSSSPYRWIIVPHENTPSHIQKLKDSLKKLGLSYLLWSEWNHQNQPPLTSSILIFDEKGWLAELYQLADIAFIGGSFKKQVHSVMEALGCGIPVLVGPFYKNNREAIEFSRLSHRNISFVKEITSDSSLLTQYLKDYANIEPSALSEIKEKIKESFKQRCGGTKKTFIEIQKNLESSHFST